MASGWQRHSGLPEHVGQVAVAVPVPHLFSLSCSLPVAGQMPARNFGEEVGCRNILIQLPPTLTIGDGLRWECERNIRKQWPTSTGGLRLLCHGFKLDKLFKHSHASCNTLFGENFDSPQKPSFSGQQKQSSDRFYKMKRQNDLIKDCEAGRRMWLGSSSGLPRSLGASSRSLSHISWHLHLLCRLGSLIQNQFLYFIGRQQCNAKIVSNTLVWAITSTGR